FGFDRRCDDDFSLLKLGDVARADVAHAGRDRADEILTTVIDFSRAEQDLFQWTGGADLDPRAARKIHMWRCHAPMVTRTARFLRAGERAPTHNPVPPPPRRLPTAPTLPNPPTVINRTIRQSFFKLPSRRRCP